LQEFSGFDFETQRSECLLLQKLRNFRRFINAMLVRILITDAGGAAFHRSGYSPKRLFTEAAIHRTLLQVEHSPNVLFTEKVAIPLWDCSPNVL
jgi:hypothetical protein